MWRPGPWPPLVRSKMMSSRTTAAVTIKNTFTQRGMPAVDPRLGPPAVSSPVPGSRDGSAMRASFVGAGSPGGEFTRHNVPIKPARLQTVASYTSAVPKLWTETIEAHRREVRDAILDATAALVAQHGLLSVTMSQIAERTGIGRATLYKYFPDVEAILTAWHQRQIGDHLGRLAYVRDQASEPGERLRAVLEAFAFITHETHAHHEDELAAVMHRDQHVVAAHAHLREMV